MQRLTEFHPGSIYLLTGPRAYTGWQMHRWIVEAALAGRVVVLIGGNRYLLYDVNYAVAAASDDYEYILDRHILLSRADTCYQMTALLKETEPGPDPVLVLDLLATFYDEGVPEKEIDRLLFECVLGLRRLSRTAPVIVSAAEKPARTRLLQVLAGQAAAVLYPPPDPSADAAHQFQFLRPPENRAG